MRLSFRIACVLGVVAASAAGLFYSRGSAQAKAAAAVPAAAPPNVLLVTLDTTRADHLGAYGDRQALTPALDALGASGTTFDNAYSQCPLTLPSHASVFTGLAPPEHGVRVNGAQRLGEGPATLAELLSRRGYATGAFVAAFIVKRKFGLARGFETYDDDLSQAFAQEVPEQLSVYRPGGAVVDSALAWLDRVAKAGDAPGPASADGRADKRPFFAWVHLYDAHAPYHSHPELDGTAYAGQASYDAEIAYVDRQVGRLLSFLDERGLRKNTLVIAFADHGEGLNEHGEAEHGYILSEEVLRVPLMVSQPGVVRAGTRVPAVVSLVDLFPTILDLAGVDAPAKVRGRSLRAALEGGTIESQPSYAETELPLQAFGWSPQHSLTTPEWKYVRTTRPEVYDRLRDRAEVFNLASARQDRRDALEQALTGVESTMAVAQAPTVAVAGEERQRLEALGYVVPSEEKSQSGKADPQKPLRDMKSMLPTRALYAQFRQALAKDAGSTAELIDMAHRLIAQSPETATFHRDLGWVLLDSGKPEDAIGEMREAVRLDPESADAHVDLGEVLRRSGGHDGDAESEFREALRIAPTEVAAQVGLGNLMSARGLDDVASGHYFEALAIDPSLAEAQYDLALSLVRRHRADLAVEHFEQALQGKPKWADAEFELANSLRELGRSIDAVEHYEAALRIAPGSADVENNLGVSLAEAGRTDEARQHYLSALRLRPDFHRPHVNLGNLLVNEGDWKDAIAHYREALRLRPEAPAEAQRLAWALAACPEAELREPARAVELAEKARAENPHPSPIILDTLAAAYAAAGQFSDASATADQAIGLARARGDAAFAAQVEGRKALYQSSRPFVAPARAERAAAEGVPIS